MYIRNQWRLVAISIIGARSVVDKNSVFLAKLKIFKSKLFPFHVKKWWGLAPLFLNDEPPLLEIINFFKPIS